MNTPSTSSFMRHQVFIGLLILIGVPFSATFVAEAQIEQPVPPPSHQKGFVLLPRGWVVERTFACFGHYRCLSKNYEECPRSTEGMI